MNNRKSIPLEQFTVLIQNPTNRLTATSVTIHENGCFNLNGKLAKELGGKPIEIIFTADAKHFILNASSDVGSIYFPKSGSKKLDEALSMLKKHGIARPAKYNVWLREEDNLWQGDLIANPTASPSKGRRNSKKS